MIIKNGGGLRRDGAAISKPSRISLVSKKKVISSSFFVSFFVLFFVHVPKTAAFFP